MDAKEFFLHVTEEKKTQLHKKYTNYQMKYLILFSFFSAFHILKQYIEKHYGNILDDTKEPKEQEENSNPEGRNDLSTQLDEEIKQLKQSKSRKNYSRIDIVLNIHFYSIYFQLQGVKAVVFIRILLEEVDPVVIVQDIFTTSKKENKSLVRQFLRGHC